MHVICLDILETFLLCEMKGTSFPPAFMGPPLIIGWCVISDNSLTTQLLVTV